MAPFLSRTKTLGQQQPVVRLVAASHHVSLHDVLNGYCLCFLTTPKAFNK
ncbi:hypothetical protein [Pontibacter liquoris]|nr:hypothetical protein [Pontibacter liquoris]